MKKINIITLSLFSWIFLIGFIVSYKNSGKIRESIRIAIIWAIVTLSPISAEAKSSGLPGADGFTPQLIHALQIKVRAYLISLNIKIKILAQTSLEEMGVMVMIIIQILNLNVLRIQNPIILTIIGTNQCINLFVWFAVSL